MFILYHCPFLLILFNRTLSSFFFFHQSVLSLIFECTWFSMANHSGNRFCLSTIWTKSFRSTWAKFMVATKRCFSNYCCIAPFTFCFLLSVFLWTLSWIFLPVIDVKALPHAAHWHTNDGCCSSFFCDLDTYERWFPWYFTCSPSHSSTFFFFFFCFQNWNRACFCIVWRQTSLNL